MKQLRDMKSRWKKCKVEEWILVFGYVGVCVCVCVRVHMHKPKKDPEGSFLIFYHAHIPFANSKKKKENKSNNCYTLKDEIDLKQNLEQCKIL